MPRQHPEDDLTEAVAQHIHYHRWWGWHNPNGEERPSRQYIDRHGKKRRFSTVGERLKRMGVLAGVADFEIHEPWFCIYCPDDLEGLGKQSGLVPCGFCGDRVHGTSIAIELKIDKNTPTKDQQIWLTEARNRGWLVKVCWTIDECFEVFRCIRPLNGVRFSG